MKSKGSDTVRPRVTLSRNATGVAGRRASELNLTPEERALLPDPQWVTEDDADAIVGLRRAKTQRPIPLEEALRKLGLERPTATGRR